MRKNRICLNAVSRKIPDSLSEDRLMFSSAGAQPISLKSFRGLGHFPNKIARVYKHEHCLPSAFRSWQVMRSGYRRALLAGMASSGVGTHRICLLISQNRIPRRFLREMSLHFTTDTIRAFVEYRISKKSKNHWISHVKATVSVTSISTGSISGAAHLLIAMRG